ncbi:MAG TPA: AMP-binding protein [Streptosporangiaceae bacterium]|nr:AMP-binding protein [Streptosporangiaceae bacterium]
MAPRTSYPLPALHPFLGLDAWRLVSARAAATPSATFLTWHPFEGDDRNWTYVSFARDALAVAAGLRARGVRAGDRVIIHLENCPEFLLAWFGCAALGAVAVTTNARSAADELRYFAGDSEAVGAITQPRFARLVGEAAPQLKWLACLDQDPAGEVTHRASGTESWAALHGDPETVSARMPDPGAPVSIQYTSGTTSRPKGVVWTHANALWAARVNAAHEHLGADDCHLITMPLFHANAFAYSLLPTIWTGGKVVLLPKWSTSRFWAVSLRHGCTWASLMGLSARAVLSIEAPARHTYRWFGAPAIQPEWQQRLGVRTVGWWGMTETVSHGIVSDPWLPARALAIGRPAPEYGIRVVGPDGRTPVQADETGALLVRGVPGLSTFAEYLNNPEATADSYDEDGWFRTGDLVTVHADGWISFADRAKDMLRVGGENVAASEIERVITEVPGVVEAAVVARRDAKLDEVPVAFVLAAAPYSDPASAPDAGLASRIAAACAAKLADFKVPRQISVVRALPRSTISKVNKSALREHLATGSLLAQAERTWLAAAAVDPSGDAE